MLIPLNEKKKGDRRSLGGNREAKIGRVSFEDAFLIILVHWPSLCLSGIDVGVCREEHIRKGGGDNLGINIGIVDGDERVDNPVIGTDKPGIDGKADNSSIGIDIPDKYRGVNNTGKGTDTPDLDNIDGGTNNPSTDTDSPNADRRTVNLGKSIEIADADKGADPNTDIADVDVERGMDNLSTRTVKADKQATATDKAHKSLFSLCQALFFVFSSKSETDSTFLSSSFVSLLFLLPLVKKKALSFTYLMAKISIFNFNKVLSLMSSVLIPLRFFARYSQYLVVLCFYQSHIMLNRGFLGQE